MVSVKRKKDIRGKTKKKKTKTKCKSKYRRFSDKDFYSGDGFVTKIWGPTMWHVLHTISFNYPVLPTSKDKTDYRKFVYSLQDVLPCGNCRKNLKCNMKEHPLTMKDMKNRDTFSLYIYELHEVVNKMLGKKSGLSYCDVRERYEHFRSRCSKTKTKTVKKNCVRSKKTHKRGCIDPLYGKGAKCIIKIVPQSVKGKSIQIDKEINKIV